MLDESSDPLEDHEYPDDYGAEDDVTVPCPECGVEIYDDAEQCPHCGQYVVYSGSSHVWTGRPIWWIVLGLLGIFTAIYVLAM